MFIDFNIDNLENFPKELQKILETQEETINDLAKNGKDYTQTIKVLEDLSEELERFFTPLSHLNSVLNSKETQKAYEESLPLISKFYSFVSQHKELYEKIKSLSPNNPLQKRVLDLEIRDFKLSGAELNEKDKKALEEINLNLSELSNQFSQNLLNATNEFELIVEPKDVEGIPASDLEQAKVEIDGKTKYRFTLQMPSYIAYMTYGKNREIRDSRKTIQSIQHKSATKPRGYR